MLESDLPSMWDNMNRTEQEETEVPVDKKSSQDKTRDPSSGPETGLEND